MLLVTVRSRPDTASPTEPLQCKGGLNSICSHLNYSYMCPVVPAALYTAVT